MKKIVISILMVIGFTMVFGQTDKLFKKLEGEYTFNKLFFLDYNEWQEAIYEPDFGLNSYKRIGKYDNLEVTVYDKSGFIIEHNDRYIKINISGQLFYCNSIEHIEIRNNNPQILDIISGDIVFTMDFTYEKPLFIMYHKSDYKGDVFKFKKVFVFH